MSARSSRLLAMILTLFVVAISANAQDPRPQRIRVGGNVAQANLISQERPVYPPLAKQARIQGTVRLQAIVGKEGNVNQLEVVAGHPLLVQAALDAVRTWRYQPTLLNGEPVEVVTTIDVVFTLGETASAEGSSGSSPSRSLAAVLQQLRQAAQDDPSNPERREALAEFFDQTGDLAEAIEQYRQSIRLNPMRLQPYLGLGMTVHRKESPHQAAAEFDVAVGAHPQAARIHSAVGFGLAGIGIVGGAVEEFHRALQLDPQDSRARAGLDSALAKKRQ